MYEKVGFMKSCYGELKALYRRICDGEQQIIYNNDPFGGEVLFGCEELPIAEVPNAEIAQQLCEFIINKMRGDYLGFIWLDNDKLLAIKDEGANEVFLIPKKAGDGEDVPYEGLEGFLSIDENLDDFEDVAEFLEFNE